MRTLSCARQYIHPMTAATMSASRPAPVSSRGWPASAEHDIVWRVRSEARRPQEETFSHLLERETLGRGRWGGMSVELRGRRRRDRESLVREIRIASRAVERMSACTMRSGRGPRGGTPNRAHPALWHCATSVRQLSSSSGTTTNGVADTVDIWTRAHTSR